jgi:heme/copper-type cytochrome/quinol oxidase subunit 2
MTKPFYVFFLILLVASLSSAAPITNWLTDPASPVAHEVRREFWTTLAIIAPFILIAEGLLLFIILKFKAKPSR